MAPLCLEKYDDYCMMFSSEIVASASSTNFSAFAILSNTAIAVSLSAV